jgi:hypothetical protein
MIKKLVVASSLAFASVLASPEPASAQPTAVQFTLFKGNSILKSQTLRAVEWHGNVIYLYGPKEANGGNKYYCSLRSTKQDVLLALYGMLKDPHLHGTLTCHAPASHGSANIGVDLENQTTTRFVMGSSR